MYITKNFSSTKKNYWFPIGVIFFLGVQLIVCSALLFDPETRPLLFWVCNNFCLFLAYACWRRNAQMFKGISYVGLITQMLWVSDFVSPLFGFNLSGIADYITDEGLTYANDVSIALHMCIPLIVLLFSVRIRPEKSSLVYASVYACAVYGGTLLFTPVADDVNCVFEGCRTSLGVPYSVVLWPVYASALIYAGYATHCAVYYVWQGSFRRWVRGG